MNPPEEPPPGVTQPLAWRVAARLWYMHARVPDEGARCGLCGEVWPCTGRRLAGQILSTTINGGLVDYQR
jgi:hypothetical protein